VRPPLAFVGGLRESTLASDARLQPGVYRVKGAVVPEQHRIERTYPTTAEKVWDLWTTPEGIESWWAPDGFTVEVEKLELEPGGELVYTMTATAPEQVEFMRNAGLPLTTTSRKRFTEVDRPNSTISPHASRAVADGGDDFSEGMRS
jgi:Activator of Hsp90 ATPase homolog 1-like protein